jgi:hypothetical protein
VATCSGVGEEAERRARRRPALLNALERRAAREKEGGQLDAVWGQDWSGEGGAGVRCRMSPHGTSVAALGRSDTGGRCTSRG